MCLIQTAGRTDSIKHLRPPHRKLASASTDKRRSPRAQKWLKRNLTFVTCPGKKSERRPTGVTDFTTATLQKNHAVILTNNLGVLNAFYINKRAFQIVVQN
jgi:hypothetical protein